MSVVTPTITTDDPHEYRDQLELISTYALGVHLDFSDGVFAPSRLLPISKAWRRDDLITHAHIMYKNPLAQLKHILKLDADLVILHAESENVKRCLEELSINGVRTGIALLPETKVEALDDLRDLFDHVLVFGGHLGFQGGEADLELLEKVKEISHKYPDAEVSWDGGINDENIKMIAKSGVNVLNVGGFLHKSEDPRETFTILQEIASAF